MREVEFIMWGGDGEERRIRQRVEMSVRRGGAGVKRVAAYVCVCVCVCVCYVVLPRQVEGAELVRNSQ